MEPTLFSFIWKHSKRDQFVLLLVTLVTFPFLYASLELPKRIINDAISSTDEMVNVGSWELTQVQFLLALSFAYLGSVLCNGLLKMRLNTMKGVLSERMLRRFRYVLITRMMRFPKTYFQRTSQGELVSMVTSEAEPMGGLMGDAVAQPVFQAGQMLIIVMFLFLQSFWFGLAGIAMIPLQAWLIPMLQRRINQLNKKRIIQVRALAAEIGETAAGAADLRSNGGWRYRRAEFTDRLGRLFEIRFRIYQTKFFMKFLNNFITQLTPFLFYAVGGVLAINGEISVGALVAALAAYKDLSSPWRELLTYYNQVQDMSLRWEIVTERFAPTNMIDEELFEGEPAEIPHLRGAIEFDQVTVRNADGNAILENISLTIPQGSRVAIKVSNQTERAALADLLTREVMPARGTVTIAGHRLDELHQSVIAARVGYAQSRPYFFAGTLGTNLLMPMQTSPKTVLWDPTQKDRMGREARRSGNSMDSLKAEWVDPGLAGLTDADDIRGWWFKLVKAMGIDDIMVNRMLDSMILPEDHPELVQAVIKLREEVYQTLKEKDLDTVVFRFDPNKFNPAMPLGGNLLFATPSVAISQEDLVQEGQFLGLIMAQGLAEQTIAISQTVIETLHLTFGKDGTEHPLFQSLGIEEELYEQLTDISRRRHSKGDGAISQDEFSLLLTVPFLFTAEQIGPAFPETFKDEILEIRHKSGAKLREAVGDMFVSINPDTYFPRLTLLENLMYGRMSRMAGAREDMARDIVADVLARHDLRQLVAETIWDIPTGIGGTNLPGIFLERSAFSRAAMKRPDILVLDKALASHDTESRSRTRNELRALMPDATLIFMEDNFATPDAYDLYVEIKNGRIDGVEQADHLNGEGEGSDDLRRKIRIIARTELFADMTSRNQRLLAFSAQWYSAAAGDVIFEQNDPPDAAYLCITGEAEMSWEDKQGRRSSISTVEPGRVIGDLAVIMNEPRQLDLVATKDSTFLRIGGKEYLSVVQNDGHVAFSLLQTVAGHLSGAAELIRASGVNVPQDFDPRNEDLDEAKPKISP
ncbi:MAG: ABC transporter transmembrane domain-containing protein [Aliishimia sp.]